MSGWIHSEVSCSSASSGMSQAGKKTSEGKTKERNGGNMAKETGKEVKIRIKRNGKKLNLSLSTSLKHIGGVEV